MKNSIFTTTDIPTQYDNLRKRLAVSDSVRESVLLLEDFARIVDQNVIVLEKERKNISPELMERISQAYANLTTAARMHISNRMQEINPENSVDCQHPQYERLQFLRLAF